MHVAIVIGPHESVHAGDENAVSAFYICNGESEVVIVDEFRWSQVLYLMARLLGSTNAKEVPNHRELPLGLVLVLVKIRRRVSEPNVRLGNRALYSCSRTGSNLVRIVLVSCTGVRWKDGMPRHLVFEKRIELRCYLRVSRLKHVRFECLSIFWCENISRAEM